MHEKVESFEKDNELKFSREQSFFDKSIGVRWIIASFFILCLFTFLHFRDVKVETLELGSIAQNFVVAQVDFDFIDNEATLILRQQAMTDIGNIYEIVQKNIVNYRNELEESLVKNQTWRDVVENATFEDIYKGLDSVERLMIKLRFTDPRTLNKLDEVNIDTNSYQIFAPHDLDQPSKIPKKIWDYIKNTALPSDQYEGNIRNFIISHFSNQEWLFEKDISSQRKLQNSVQAFVPDKYTHVNAGGRIIDQGDKVTARHIEMLQSMKQVLRDQRNLWHPSTLLGSFLMTLLITFICYGYLSVNQKQIVQSNRKLFLLITITVLTLGISKLTEIYVLSSYGNLAEVVRYPLFVPFAAIMLCCLMNANIATFVSGVLVIVISMTLSFDRPGFMIINLAPAIVAILNIKTLRQRKEIFIVCGKAWICSVFIVIAINFYNNTFFGFGILTDILGTAFSMLLTAVLVVGLLPLFESFFKIMTEVTLMEYMDPNNDLLRRLSIEAPGTYQHSIVVGNLAEAAALAIGANGLFCRVSTLYHDIGKMITPQYFTENQQSEMNIHQLLTPLESAQVIIAHVSEGVQMARKAGLPEQFIDIIKEHHGTTLVYYFYKNQVDEAMGNFALVDEKDFRYSGPTPRSKESGIIMIADTLEAASRSLEVVDDASVRELADRLIKEKTEDGQFDECLLTFEELAIVKETLIKTLCAFAHLRVKYPRRMP